MAKSPFQRAITRTARNSNDSTGRVTIVVTRTEKGALVKGNISRSISVENSTVTDVAAFIEKHLFGE